ncbi:TetR family transcriptional regulator [Nakamurella sp. YIM 132087]|uniref:TetR family transcriptional regulator n=1 Tax=Nakamurella alba TaxID=2665158 RepID=A0A7K1FXA6_9ACTN|nr:TetR/AcrR family transcriptional regulator [Nakamurella alba]MTD17464.1 TetR family transcriptional regulator [Nakamurella alba]
MEKDLPLSGRRAQARRNDEGILAAAREVFVADPAAPVAAVAERAGVGISALYRRYPGKDVLLQTLCRIGQERYLQLVLDALAGLDRSPTTAADVFRDFARGVVDADTHALTSRLAGRFTPSAENLRLATETGPLYTALVRRMIDAGALRPDVDVRDLTHLFEMFSSVRLGGAERSAALRRRYLVMVLDGLMTTSPSALPDVPPVGADEAAARWVPVTPTTPA